MNKVWTICFQLLVVFSVKLSSQLWLLQWLCSHNWPTYTEEMVCSYSILSPIGSSSPSSMTSRGLSTSRTSKVNKYCYQCLSQVLKLIKIHFNLCVLLPHTSSSSSGIRLPRSQSYRKKGNDKQFTLKIKIIIFHSKPNIEQLPNHIWWMQFE